LLSNINDNEIELISKNLDEIIQAYLRYNNKIGHKNFSSSKILENYESNSQEIFNYLINNQTIQHYEVIVGKFYEKGFGIKKDESIAFKWYMKACKQNNSNGYFEAGYCYYYGCGIEKNKKKAFEFCQLAANNGLNIALYFFANYFSTQNNLLETFELYKKSAENEFIYSQYELAKCYNYGKGTRQNKKEALKWYGLYQKNNGKHDASFEIEEIEKELVEFYIFFILNFVYIN
jgi:TPR repeat protein